MPIWLAIWLILAPIHTQPTQPVTTPPACAFLAACHHPTPQVVTVSPCRHLAVCHRPSARR